MNYVDNIRNFKPSCEQEEKDKKLIEELIKKYQDQILYRESELFHFTSAAFIVNETFDKILMVNHNMYHSWAWAGGHADGEKNLLNVAIKEAKEETAITRVEPIILEPISLDILTTSGHYKKEKYISGHLHLNVSFLLKANEKDELHVKPDENSGVDWISIYEVEKYVTDPEMYYVCKKVIEKIKKLKIN